MDKRTIEVSLQTAKEWYNSKNEALKKVALQAFSKEELTRKSFRDIKTVNDAICYLKDNQLYGDLIEEYEKAPCTSYSETLATYRIVVAALTHNEDRHFTTGECWFPVVQFCKIGKEEKCHANKKIGTIEHDGKKYTVMGGFAHRSALAGLGRFDSASAVSDSWATVSFRSVSRCEIAEYISEQFGRLLFEVHYGGVNCDWEWID